MKYLFLVNPCAGGGKGKLVWQQVNSFLAAKFSIRFDHVVSQYAGHPRYLAMQAAQRTDLDCLVVVGGDGTLHEAITGLMESQQEKPFLVAYIPAGTSNDFARGYGISTKPLQALQQILTNQHAHVINIGHYHDACRQHSSITSESASMQRSCTPPITRVPRTSSTTTTWEPFPTFLRPSMFSSPNRPSRSR